MKASYLVTTDKQALDKASQSAQIVMLDGTVPGWSAARPGDLHFDHHRPGGAPVQLAEIPDNVRLGERVVFVTTQVDADACVAAAWVQLLQLDLDPAEAYQAYRDLCAIAYDCDHLGVPESLGSYAKFAANVVAALKLSGNQVAESLGLSSDRRAWTPEEKENYASVCFQRGTEWLVQAALGQRPWPGEAGEAEPYFANLERLRPEVAKHCRLYRNCTVFDQRSFKEYVDPRLVVDWARAHGAANITLTVRDGSRLPNALPIEQIEQDAVSYTLGSVPLHSDGSPQYSDRGVWQKLTELEVKVRASLGLPAPETTWGGRNEVGGSGWRDPSVVSPEEILDQVFQV